MARPNIEAAFRDILFVEGFSIPVKVAKIIKDVIKTFNLRRNEILYNKKPIILASDIGSNNSKVTEPIEQEDEVNSVNIKDVRLAIKLACLMRNQEFSNFYTQVMNGVNTPVPLPPGKLKHDTRDTIVFHDEMD